MKLFINDHRKLSAIRDDFSAMFPNLSLVFYERPHHQQGGTAEHIETAGGKTLGECRIVHNKGALTIAGGMSAADLEENFRDIYGLIVKVTVKSGRSFPEGARNGKTLDELNNEMGS